MSAPVTRGELHEALGIWGGALRAEMTGLGGQLRAEMADLGGALRAEMAVLRHELRSEMAQLRGDVSTDIARHTKAMIEEMRRIVGIVDDQYKSLPPRVDRLEAKVFAKRKR